MIRAARVKRNGVILVKNVSVGQTCRALCAAKLFERIERRHDLGHPTTIFQAQDPPSLLTTGPKVSSPSFLFLIQGPLNDL